MTFTRACVPPIMSDSQFESTDTPERPIRLGDATIDMGASEGNIQTVQAEHTEPLMADSAQPMQANVSDRDDRQVAVVHEDSRQVSLSGSPPSPPSRALSPLSVSESPAFHSGARQAHSSRPSSRSSSPASQHSRHVTFESPEPYASTPFIPPLPSTPWFPPPRSLSDPYGSGFYSANDPQPTPPGFVLHPPGTYHQNNFGPQVDPFEPVIPPGIPIDWGPGPTQDAYWNANTGMYGYADAFPFGSRPANPWDYTRASTPSLRERSRRNTFENWSFPMSDSGGGYKPNFDPASESWNTVYTNDSYGIERHPTGLSRTSPSPSGTPVPFNSSSPLLGATLRSPSQEQTVGSIDDDGHEPSTRRVPYIPGQTPFIFPIGFVPQFFEPYGDHLTADEAHSHMSAHPVVYPPHVVFNPGL